MTPTLGRLDHLADVSISNVDKHSIPGETVVRLCNYTDVYKNTTITKEMPFMKASASDRQISLFSIKAGDTLLTKDSETADDIGIPAFVSSSADDIVCGYHLAIARPRSETVPKFLYWLLESEFVKSQWLTAVTGVTRVGIRLADLRGVRVPAPSKVEQALIADYLDRETAQIDALIAKQQQLITTLRERRMGSLRAQFEQFRDLPAVPLRRVSQVLGGGTPTGEPDNWDGEVPFATPADLRAVNGATLYETARSLTEKGVRTGSTIARAGSVILSIRAPVGYAAVTAVDTAFNQGCRALIPSNRIDPDFLMLWFYANADKFAAEGRGTTFMEVSGGQTASFAIRVPTIHDQHKAVESAKNSFEKIDTLIARAERFIELAKERRATLITAAVTGQAKIPTMAKPDEPDRS